MIFMFLDYVLSVWELLINYLDNTDIGGFSVLDVIVVVGVISIFIGMLFNKKE